MGRSEFVTCCKVWDEAAMGLRKECILKRYKLKGKENMIEVGGAKCTVDHTWSKAFTVECIVKMLSKNERFPARGLKRIRDMDMVE